MKIRPLLLMVFAVAARAEDPAAIVPPAGPVDVPPARPAVSQPRILGRSEQFRVSGGTGIIRGSVALLAEETKDELLAVCGEKDEWKVPVSIVLRGSPGDPAPPRTLATSLFFNEAGYELRLDVHLARGIERGMFRDAVTAALLYERALRTRKPKEDDPPLVVPPWLVEGLREAADWKRQRAERRAYEALFKNGGVFRPAEIFDVTEASHAELDAALRMAFRVSSGALVMALLEQPDGRASFRRFLQDAAAFAGEMPVLLRQHFPGLNLSESSLTKWWALQLAHNAAPTLTEALSVSETEAALKEALRLQFRAADGSADELPLDRWAELPELGQPERALAVRPAQEALVRLSYRCFPSYRPLLAEYQIALRSLVRGERGKLPGQLEGLRAARENMITKTGRGRDFLDWFEITRAREISGEFDDYLRLKERLVSQRRQRSDPLSLYLDRMDAIFTRGERVGAGVRSE